MNWADLVIVLALCQFFFFGALVGQARGKYGVAAPAVSGHEMFERLYRVQMNTLELLMVFVPAIALAAKYWSPVWAAGLGVVYLVGRMIYWRTYVANPASRSLGFGLSAGPALALLVGALVGMARQGGLF
ncbi:MAPEG family protein [Roseateles koreensis]|uniref:MAPEG family protein n=1 Tax=Roseateles koreensis TaxID=2987526 RepID=A0ABT5KUJ8_9BURK|nr:MAPEG family protein [Roseateles koreensis]MDC8786618.1 MAPEG family protein [Roseateles koreensis]